jgi:hypothetical protein
MDPCFFWAGKIHRSSYERETLDQFHLSQEHSRAPATEMQVKLQGVFARVLHRPAHRIGAEDDFFRLGGDSLVTMKLVGYARS